MAGDKYLYNNGGIPTEKAAVQSSAGAGDAGKLPALDATGKLDSTLMPVGIGSESDLIATTEDLAAGDFVNIYDATGTKCRKADATTAGKEANGFVLATTTSGQNATVYRTSQINTQLTSMTPGKVQYLSTTAGLRTETVPTGTGKVQQALGVAVSATEMRFDNARFWIVLA
jgi:hypothetical protein